MYIKVLIFAFCASQIACGEIADNLRQEYEDMINNTTELFTNWTNFVNTMAQNYGFKITQRFQELEKQRVDLRRELEVLATASRYNDSHVMSCLKAGQTHIYSVIDDSEFRLQDLSLVENNFLREVLANVEYIGDALDAFVIRTWEAIALCDGENSDDMDSCFSGLYPETNNSNINIMDQINEQSLFSIQVFSRSEENFNNLKNDTEIYVNTGAEDARQELMNCIAINQTEVASGEIDNLRQEYEDIIYDAAQLFANLSYFVTAMAQQYGVRITSGMQEVEKQMLDLTDRLQVLATESIFYYSRLMDCFVSGQTPIYTIIGDTEYRLLDLWQVQNNYLVVDIQNIGDALDAFVIQTQEAIGLFDGVNSDDIDSYFSELYPEIINANTNILDQINEQSLSSIQYYIRYDEIINGYNSDTEIYINTGYEDARQELTNCMEVFRQK